MRIYPVTIVLSRYNGTYEPGRWIAFPLPAERLPEGWDGSDVPCADFWADHPDEFGGGDTPQAAYDDLLRLVEMRRIAEDDAAR